MHKVHANWSVLNYVSIRNPDVSKIRSEKRARNLANNIKQDADAVMQDDLNSLLNSLTQSIYNIKQFFGRNNLDSYNANEWQELIIPFFSGKNIMYIPTQIYKPNRTIVRFILDFNTTHLGEIKFDCFVRFNKNDFTLEKFDLHLVTSKKLTEEFKDHLMDIFLRGQKSLGIRGNFFFSE
jgi:hypothetical protein